MTGGKEHIDDKRLLAADSNNEAKDVNNAQDGSSSVRLVFARPLLQMAPSPALKDLSVEAGSKTSSPRGDTIPMESSSSIPDLTRREGKTVTFTDEVSADPSTVKSETNDFSLHFRSCMLTALGDKHQFRESLTYSTLLIEIHHENLNGRAFHAQNVGEYNTLVRQESDSNGPSTQSAPAAKGAKAAPVPGPTLPPPGPIRKSDRFLQTCVKNALVDSGKLQPHGSARVRLEPLLSSSIDLLKEFERTRLLRRNQVLPPEQADVETGSGVENADDGKYVVVKEDMLIEVLLEKPSMPPKWGMPKEISLRGALQRALEEKQSKLGLTKTHTGRRTVDFDYFILY